MKTFALSLLLTYHVSIAVIKLKSEINFSGKKKLEEFSQDDWSLYYNSVNKLLAKLISGVVTKLLNRLFQNFF